MISPAGCNTSAGMLTWRLVESSPSQTLMCPKNTWDLVTVQMLMGQDWVGAWEFAFLTVSQVMLTCWPLGHTWGKWSKPPCLIHCAYTISELVLGTFPGIFNHMTLTVCGTDEITVIRCTSPIFLGKFVVKGFLNLINHRQLGMTCHALSWSLCLPLKNNLSKINVIPGNGLEYFVTCFV